MKDYLVVGAGLFGSVFAFEMRKRGKNCLVIDKRSHIGGNCYTEKIDGIDVHMYGPHIFHTESKSIWEYVNRLCDFKEYRHRVKACSNDELYSFPINLNTLKQVYATSSDSEALQMMEQDRQPYLNPIKNNLEEWCLSQIGPTLYYKFIHGYTEKQWKTNPDELDSSVIKRLPIRTTDNDEYYNHEFQGLPLYGYTPLFERLLENVELRLGVNYFQDREFWDKQAYKVVYTGEIDRFFDYKFGRLGWRSLDFEKISYEVPFKQECAIYNYVDKDTPYTREVEYKHWTHDQDESPYTHLIREYPAFKDETHDAYYPIPSTQNKTRYKDYFALATQSSNVIFGGRLAKYAYIDMAPTIKMALNMAKKETQTLN